MLGLHSLNYATRKKLYGYMFILPWIVGFLIFQLTPMIWSFFLSFQYYDIVTPPQFLGLENYARMLGDEVWRSSFGKTLYYVGFTVPGRVILALGLAMLLNVGLKGTGAFRTIFYLPSVTSGVAVSILFRHFYNARYGAINSALALVGIDGPNWLLDSQWAMPSLIIMSLWTLSGRYMVIFLAGLQTIPDHLYESATIDGASGAQKFFKITLPMLSPTIYLVSVMGVIHSFQVFTYAYMFTASGEEGSPANLNALRVYILYLYTTGFQDLRMGYASAMAWVLFLVILGVTLFQSMMQKRLVYYESNR